jgi:hypothetical protein
MSGKEAMRVALDLMRTARGCLQAAKSVSGLWPTGHRTPYLESPQGAVFGGIRNSGLIQTGRCDVRT